MAEGAGFEPAGLLKATGLANQRINPLCQPSMVGGGGVEPDPSDDYKSPALTVVLTTLATLIITERW